MEDKRMDDHTSVLIEELPGEVLSALEESSRVSQLYGNEIHHNIVNIIEGIVTEGLNKEQREELIKDIMIPNNASF